MKPVQFSYGQVLVRGGKCAKAVTIPTRKIVIEGREVVFGQLGESLPGVMKCVTGHINRQRANMSRCRLLADIFARVHMACETGGVRDAEAAGEHDPMDDIDDGNSATATTKGKQKAQPKLSQGKVHHVGFSQQVPGGLSGRHDDPHRHYFRGIPPKDLACAPRRPMGD